LYIVQNLRGVLVRENPRNKCGIGFSVLNEMTH